MEEKWESILPVISPILPKNNKNVLFYMSLTVPSHFMNQAAMIKGPSFYRGESQNGSL